jgi:hypothetical protein
VRAQKKSFTYEADLKNTVWQRKNSSQCEALPNKA